MPDARAVVDADYPFSEKKPSGAAFARRTADDVSPGSAPGVFRSSAAPAFAPDARRVAGPPCASSACTRSIRAGPAAYGSRACVARDPGRCRDRAACAHGRARAWPYGNSASSSSAGAACCARRDGSAGCRSCTVALAPRTPLTAGLLRRENAKRDATRGRLIAPTCPPHHARGARRCSRPAKLRVAALRAAAPAPPRAGPGRVRFHASATLVASTCVGNLRPRSMVAPVPGYGSCIDSSRNALMPCTPIRASTRRTAAHASARVGARWKRHPPGSGSVGRSTCGPSPGNEPRHPDPPWA